MLEDGFTFFRLYNTADKMIYYPILGLLSVPSSFFLKTFFS